MKPETNKDDLANRLSKLEEKLDTKRAQQVEQQNSQGMKDAKGFSYGLKIASEFLSAILVGGAIGWGVDKWLDSSPFAFIALLLLGFVAGVLNVLRTTGQVAPFAASQNDEPKND